MKPSSVRALGICCLAGLLWSWVAVTSLAAEPARISISGRYPHLAVFNTGDECGIGAVVPWADRLWAVTYSPHFPRGSDDKLYEIDAELNIVTREESIGGTPANRLIHRESKQLFIGPYVIDAEGSVRVIPYDVATGRPTATIRHLTDPANKVYTFTMEEGFYEIDVHSLDVKTIHTDSHVKGFVDYLPGYHGKGGYSGQGRVVVSNNGKKGPHSPFNQVSGCLAEWDGTQWDVIRENQFNEVTGPGGIHGDSSHDEPIWATGWDLRSLLLMVRDNGRWHCFRLPIGDYSYMASHGWYTEWPRIRQIGPDGQYLMNMHGLWFDLPKTFSLTDRGGLRPLGSHLKITADFCRWREQLVFACDDTAITGGNRFVSQSQSNLWFCGWEDLKRRGRPAGWGGVWLRDEVKADSPSDPYHFAGYTGRMVHLSHETGAEVTFSVELDKTGGGKWTPYKSIAVPAGGYDFCIFPDDLEAEWVRLRTDRNCEGATAYFHYGPGGGAVAAEGLFDALADVAGSGERSMGIIRPRGSDLGTLQMLGHRAAPGSQVGSKPRYYEIGPQMELQHLADEQQSVEFLKKTAGLTGADFSVDEASAIVESGRRRYRLPVSDQAYKEPWSIGWPRGIREVVTERRLLNCCGTFYVLPHASAGGVAGIKPVSTHNKAITDFCSWRGMLVMAGARGEAEPDGHHLKSDDGQVGLWFGDVDDLWQLGKPRGQGGPWKNSSVQSGQPSDPYLMTGYDHKTLELSHDADGEVVFNVEVDFFRDNTWRTYRSIKVAAGESVSHEFPAGFSAHWIRCTADRDCRATAWFVYQ